MAPVLDREHQAVVADGAAVAVAFGDLRIAQHQVGLGHPAAGLVDGVQARRDQLHQLRQQLRLQGVGQLLGLQDGALGLLQLGRVEAGGVDQGLLLLVVGRHLVQVLVGDLEVVAEDLVEAHLQAADARGLALAGLQAGQEALAVAQHGAVAVQLRVDAGGDVAAAAHGGRGVLVDGVLQCARPGRRSRRRCPASGPPDGRRGRAWRRPRAARPGRPGRRPAGATPPGRCARWRRGRPAGPGRRPAAGWRAGPRARGGRPGRRPRRRARSPAPGRSVRASARRSSSRRRPRGVTVPSMWWTRVPGPRSPRKVRKTSRLRRVSSSRTRRSPRALKRRPVTWGGLRRVRAVT